MSEMNILKRIMLRCSKLATLFRQNTGVGWVGDAEKIFRRQQVWVGPGDVVVRKARPLHAGLVKGSSDLIGWTKIKITESMVGRVFAIFTAIEVKDRTDPTPEQENFIDQVRGAGGIAGVARSEAAALALLDSANGGFE